MVKDIITEKNYSSSFKSTSSETLALDSIIGLYNHYNQTFVFKEKARVSAVNVT